MGGRNAYMLAARRPEGVKALVIVDHGPEPRREGSGRIRNFVQLPDLLDSYEEFVQRVHQYQPHRPLEQIRGSLVHNVKQLPNGKWTWKYDKALRDPSRSRPGVSAHEAWQQLKKIRCPTLIVRGSESDLFARETAEKMLQAIPNASFAEVERAGHLVPGDNPVGFIEALINWLDSRF
jgi:pimeloyl-ACP methyl ester carboxylesterase